ncbi:MAG: efflux RND transporter periplasmic adaptor subunit [Candidatus Krumholzibacteriota bacterium]|nr:efflux RND transporter periplasmic adaptor subunit [Candidatus Krumholzibacteriota bacterium]
MNINWNEISRKHGIGLAVSVLIVITAFALGFLLRGSGESPPGHEMSHEDTGAAGRKPQSTIWTCSMHPQIQLREPGKCPICFMDLIPVESGDDGEELGERQLKMTKSAALLAGIQTTPAVRKFVEAKIRMTGNIDYDETGIAYITAWMPGRLELIFANYTGVTVTKGDPLASIYSPALVSAQEELIQARRAVESISKSENQIFKGTTETTLDAARKKLLLYGLTEEQIKHIELSSETSDHLTINAPRGGTVIEKNVWEGMYVNTGTRIYTIADLSRVWIFFQAYQSDLPWLDVGRDVEFTSLAFPGNRFIGKITFIDPVFDEKTRSVNIRVEADNRLGRLKPGMFVSGTVSSILNIRGEAVDKATAVISEAPLVIPVTAPLVTGKRAVVYIKLPETEMPVFEGREVELGPRAGDYYIVKSGLIEGELVVTNGAFKIDSELQILARPSMMNPEGGTRSLIHQHERGTGTPEIRPGTHMTGENGIGEMAASERQKGEGQLRDYKAVNALEPVYDTYFRIQMALAADDYAQAVKINKKMVGTVKKVDMNLFQGNEHKKWMELSGEIVKSAEKGVTAKNIAESRHSFLLLSRTMIELHDVFGHKGSRDFFLTFCPMADDNQGAFWLQEVDTVYNSFYGASMLRCGTIKEKMPPK